MHSFRDGTKDPSEISVVVVHHKSEDTLVHTIASLSAEGVGHGDIVIVDNSEDSEVIRRLRDRFTSCQVLQVSNRGYGAAVNAGVKYLTEKGKLGDYVLVSTHEARIQTGSLNLLIRELENHPSAGVVGPVLVTGKDGDTVWSAGGLLTRFLNLPRHRGHNLSLDPQNDFDSKSVDWLDGALLLYRSDLLREYPISESYFLYSEEVDHQSMLRKAGWEIKIVGSARAWQSSNGVPNYWLVRNSRLYHRRNSSRVRQVISPAYVYARAMIKSRLARSGDEGLIRAARRASLCESTDHVIVVNALGAALRHYVAELEDTFSRVGLKATVLNVLEPSAAEYGRAGWIQRYISAMTNARRISRQHAGAPVLSVWPVAGYVDLFLMKLFFGRDGWLVIHDPRPLVRNIGSGRAVQVLAQVLRRGRNVIVHSQLAADHVAEDIGWRRSIVVRHPVRTSQTNQGDAACVDRVKIVRVLGQYKPDRDIDALREIARSSGNEKLEIHGRGWPSIEGWDVYDRFVPESELDELIETADLVVIPYKRFYQSGIATRCLEKWTPFIGPPNSSLIDMAAGHSELTAERSWSDAFRAGLATDKSIVGEWLGLFQKRTDKDWQDWHAIAIGHKVP